MREGSTRGLEPAEPSEPQRIVPSCCPPRLSKSSPHATCVSTSLAALELRADNEVRRRARHETAADKRRQATTRSVESTWQLIAGGESAPTASCHRAFEAWRHRGVVSSSRHAVERCLRPAAAAQSPPSRRPAATLPRRRPPSNAHRQSSSRAVGQSSSRESVIAASRDRRKNDSTVGRCDARRRLA